MPAVSHYTLQRCQSAWCAAKAWATHNLQLDSLSLYFYRTDLEVHANGAQVAVCERIFCEPEEQARLHVTGKRPPSRNQGLGAYLSDAGVADEEEFEQVVVSVGHAEYSRNAGNQDVRVI